MYKKNHGQSDISSTLDGPPRVLFPSALFVLFFSIGEFVVLDLKAVFHKGRNFEVFFVEFFQMFFVVHYKLLQRDLVYHEGDRGSSFSADFVQGFHVKIDLNRDSFEESFDVRIDQGGSLKEEDQFKPFEDLDYV
jgi:hypothetical protein